MILRGAGCFHSHTPGRWVSARQCSNIKRHAHGISRQCTCHDQSTSSSACTRSTFAWIVMVLFPPFTLAAGPSTGPCGANKVARAMCATVLGQKGVRKDPCPVPCTRHPCALHTLLLFLQCSSHTACTRHVMFAPSLCSLPLHYLVVSQWT